MPRVSVIIPTCNREQLVVEAAASALAQTFTDLEVVVCDDGSTDGTGPRVRALGARVRYVRIDHTGRLGAVRNRAIAASRGELLAFLDDDDLFDPEHVAKQVARIDREPALDAVYVDRAVLMPDGSTLGPVPSADPDAEGCVLDRVLAGHHPHPCTLMIRRAALERAGGWDESMETGEDLELWTKLGRWARVARVPESLTLVRRQPGSLSERDPNVTFGNTIAVLERELRAPDLTRRQRLLCRRTLAVMRAGWADALAARRDWSGARAAALRAVATLPSSRSAWRALARVWLGISARA